MRLNEFVSEEWSQKYKSSINCSNPKGFSQKAHCAGKRKHNESVGSADQAAVDALLKKHGWSMGRTVNGDLAFTWQGSTYVFYGERMRINWPNGQSVSVVWGHKPDWQGRGNEVSYAQAVQKKYLTFDLPIWQALDRGQISDSQALQRFKAENERQAREAVKVSQGVTEGLAEARNSLFAFVKQQFPTWPNYVLKDFLYAQAKGIRDQAELDDFLKRNKQDFGNCKWTLTKLPITFDIFTPKTQRMLASREGGSSNPFQVPRDAERHAQQSQMIQQKGVSAEPIIVAKLSNGYDLIEGWHRTIQNLKAFPQGYTGPAWVCTGATYTSESVNQGVTEGSDKKEATRRIQKMLNTKFGANLDVDGVLGPLTLQSINKFMPDAKIGLADDPEKTTAVQGKKVKASDQLDVTEGPIVPRIVHPGKISIYLRIGAGRAPVLVATDVPYAILDKYIEKVIQKYPQFKPTDFSFKSSDAVS